MSANPANAHNPMLPALRRWQAWPRGERRTDRWARWSELRRNRGARLDARGSRLSMRLLVGHRPVSLISTSRHATSVAHLHLSVRPVFLTPSSQLRPERVSPATQPGAVSRQVLGTPMQLLAHAVSRPATPRRVDGAREYRVVATSPIGAQSSVFRRELDVISRSETSERVVRSFQRVEQPVRSTTVLQQRVNVTGDVERALAASNQRAAGPAEQSRSNANWPGPGAGFSMPNGMELERLTDQIVTRIDDRLTAHRERMGRAF